MPIENFKTAALITGGGSGIGLAIAERFVKEGIRAIILGRDLSKLKSAKEKLGEGCEYVQGDLTDLKSLPPLINDITSNFGPVNILVNNAGINMKRDFVEVSNEDFQSILSTNVTGMFAISREMVRHMMNNGGGCILNISSMAAQYGIPKVIAYTASKSAIEGMTRAMAVELAPKKIRVNCIAPGFIATDMSSKALANDPERMNKVLSRTPAGKLGLPGDVAEGALFLCTEASGYITGVILPVDGGNSIGF
jgi:NAD(P)-dependent dehydrogenase (short-subunit alcohol dehydrogenase family)